MSVNLTYPGVYIREVSSGVRTITGVSTSVTAFVGKAKRGPINKATRVYSFADYEREFGGLHADSQMSYAVRQFFSNGGGEAWIVRVVKAASAALRELNTGGTTPRDVLRVKAVAQGEAGNTIEVRVDHKTRNPVSTFNLTVNYEDPNNSADAVSETFINLSMNENDASYAKSAINGVSRLVVVDRIVPDSVLNALPAGTSVSGSLAGASDVINVAPLIDSAHNGLQISINGLPPVTVVIDHSNAFPSCATTNIQRLNGLCDEIERRVTTSNPGESAFDNFTCTRTGTGANSRILMRSGVAGEKSSVVVSPAGGGDASIRLRLGLDGGGTELYGVASIRPAESPASGSLSSGVLADSDLASNPHVDRFKLDILVNGYALDTVELDTAAAVGGNLTEKLQNVAARIEAKVRALKVGNPAYRHFSCRANTTDNKLVLSSGTRGEGSTVVVQEAADKDIAGALKLLTGVSRAPGANEYLRSGSETPYTDADLYNVFIANRDDHKGIYALEDVNIFNLLCLPGVTNSGVLMDAVAYCQEKRAFFIIDAPPDAESAAQMVAVAKGTALPRNDHAAVYFPWIEIGDPLKNGALRKTPPCGAVAGLYARTDSTRGVWKAPAGTEATLNGVQGVAIEHPLTDPENDDLNPLGVNCIRLFPVFNAVAWGSRTLLGADAMASEYKYVPVRRLASFIEESLSRGTKWVVFEPNDEPLWAQIRLNVGAFMLGLFRRGAFQGASPRDAYLVKCDKETTTQTDINNGIVNIVVGFAPLKPAEFVIITITQLAGDIQT